ncbi:unnamed protein product, partial [Durusdinium trenchii]
MLMEPVPPPAVSPEPPLSDEEALAAKRKLMRIVRARPEVLRALQVRKASEDRAIMKGLAKYKNHFEIFRLAGCSIPEATEAEELYELALEAPIQRPKKKSRKWLWFTFGGVVLLLLLILVGLIVIQVTQASQGFQIGSCTISLFTNSSCQQD